MTTNTLNDPAMQSASVYIHQFPENLPARKFQGIPGIACTPAGTLWGTWYGGGDNEGPDNYILLTHRSNANTPWSEPWLIVFPEHPNVRAFDPTLWVDPLKRLWLFWAQGYSPKVGQNWDGRAGVWGICCEQPDVTPEQWSAPRRFCDGIMMNKPTLDEQGNWLMPSSIWGLKPYHPDVAESQRGPSVAISCDQGKTAVMQQIAMLPDRLFDEHHIIPLRDGRWAMWARSKTDTATVSYSTDRGQTWSAGEHCSIPCPNSRFYVMRLQSGALLLVSHLPLDPMLNQRDDWNGRSHLTAWVSDDEGQTWVGQLLIDARWPVSYPDVDQAADGTIHVIYDFDRRGAGQIMHASLTEAQIRAGHPQVTPMLINAMPH
jgi:predicted neuraminidase